MGLCLHCACYKHSEALWMLSCVSHHNTGCALKNFFQEACLDHFLLCAFMLHHNTGCALKICTQKASVVRYLPGACVSHHHTRYALTKILL